MSKPVKLIIVGEFNADFLPHRATDAALEHAAAVVGVEIDPLWVPTTEFASPHGEALLNQAHALWIAPGGPYRSLTGALQAIRFARQERVPLLGTCAGFQHLVLEYARNVLNFADAEHAEYNPDASCLFIARLPCSLVDRVLPIDVSPGSRAARLYGKTQVLERYYCNFAINPRFAPLFASGGLEGELRVVGRDDQGEIRILELAGHPFFLGTLFVPQLQSTAQQPHPLVVGFLQQARRAAEQAGKR